MGVNFLVLADLDWFCLVCPNRTTAHFLGLYSVPRVPRSGCKTHAFYFLSLVMQMKHVQARHALTFESYAFKSSYLEVGQSEIRAQACKSNTMHETDKMHEQKFESPMFPHYLGPLAGTSHVSGPRRQSHFRVTLSLIYTCMHISSSLRNDT